MHVLKRRLGKMEGFSRTVNVLLFVLFHTMKEVSSSGKISINLKRYENPGGEGHNGHCCDGRAFFCFGACDHRFLLCVDDRYGSSNMGRCPYGRVQTGVIPDADTIVFYGSVGGTRNPMTLNFNTWPGSVKLKVYVEDYDDNSNDYVDYLTTVITATPDKSDDAAYPSSYLLRRRTRLSIEVKVYCDNYYFGPRCDVYCEPRDDHTGHYTCDQANGNKICKPGWSGTFCASSNDDCIGNQCQNGAICMDSHRSYICACSDGFTGKFCEQDIDECSVGLPCANGGSCVNTHGGYSCRCAHAWTGTDCSEAVNFCESNPCRNGAVCHSSQAGYHCACSKSWTGSQCDQNVDECLAEPCLNNGTCLDTHGSFQCLCINGTTGHLCEINIDDCASGPCIHDNATCNDIINGYKCACPPGITGTNCVKDSCFQRSCQTCYSGSVTLDLLGGGTTTTGSIPDITILEGPESQPNVQKDCSKMALVKVKFSYPDATDCLNLLKIELEFGADRKARMFNFGDSHSNNGAGGDGTHQENDAEIDNIGNMGKKVKIEGSDKCNSADLNLHTDAVGPNVTRATVWIGNQYYRITNDAGLDEELCHECLFALAGQSDNEGAVNEEIYLAFNSVVNGNSGRRGYGTCSAKISWECPTPSGTGEMFEIQLPTTLDSSEEDIVRGALQDILQENSDYAQGEIHIETHFGTFTSHDGDVSTVISLKAFYKETQLDQSFLQKIYTPDKLAQLKELLHLRKEESVQLLQISEEKPHEKENWALSHWYAILIIALVVIVLLLIPVAIHIRRKRGRRASEMDLTAYWPASQDVPSLGFENVVYNVEHQPQYQNIPAESENSEEMTDLTSGPSNVANGRRMDSFKNESSRS